MGIKFLNPYHFIPLQEGKPICKEEESEKSYTGVLSYEVTTRTPLLIPGQILKRDKEPNDKEGEATGHPYKRFFTYDHTGGDLSMDKKYRPAIPGSEIRGVIRSIYETLTNSCLSMIDEEEAITRRVSDIFSAGLIRRTDKGGIVKYILLPSEKAQIDYQTIDRLELRDGAVCKGTIKGRFFDILDGSKKKDYLGYLLKGEKTRQGGRKSHYTMMYLKGTNSTGIELSDADIKNLQRVLSVYDDERLNKQISKNTHWYAGYKEELDKFLSGTLTNDIGAEPMFPVYYSEVKDSSNKNRMLYLSPACITKEIYNTMMKDIITGYQPCRNKMELCPACSLFGMAGDTNEDSLAGKLRFTDLTIPDGAGLEGYYYFDKKYCDSNGMVTLQELSMPKPSAAEFYLQMPENVRGDLLNWNYDYCVHDDGHGSKFMLDGNGYHPKIMGRKYYWHNLSPKFAAGTAGAEGIKTKRNQTVQLVDKNKTFHGKIYFDRISKTELRRLVWICNISSQWEGHGFKIGGGKPLGLGSVEMHASSIYCRTLGIQDGSIQYCGHKPLEIEELFEGAAKEQYYQKSCFSETVLPQFRMMTEFLNGDNASEGGKFLIAYPVAFHTGRDEASGTKADGYLWFSNNRTDASNGKRNTVLKRSNMRFEQHLERFDDISSAQLYSTVKSIPASGRQKELAAEKEESASSFKISSDFIFNTIFKARVTGKEQCGKKGYIVKFEAGKKKTGEIKLDKKDAENIKKGSEIDVVCTGFRNSKYIFKLAGRKEK